ncbi:MAG: nucleotidyltransferase domain-containing protein [Phycisphaerae bacterium]
MRLRQEHPEVLRVGCFGSYVRGDYVPGSDLDVLIEVSAVSAELGPRRADRAGLYTPESFPVGVDLFVYTSEELAAQRAAGTGFVRTIDREILWLTDAA